MQVAGAQYALPPVVLRCFAGSSQVSHVAPPSEAEAEGEAPLPPLPGSPDHMQGSCFTFITPKQVDGSVLSPLGWLVSLLCSYQAPVTERVQHLHVVRHAERADAADPAWKDSADRPWDPPLSERGKEQAYLVRSEYRAEQALDTSNLAPVQADMNESPVNAPPVT